LIQIYGDTTNTFGDTERIAHMEAGEGKPDEQAFEDNRACLNFPQEASKKSRERSCREPKQSSSGMLAGEPSQAIEELITIVAPDLLAEDADSPHREAGAPFQSDSSKAARSQKTGDCKMWKVDARRTLAFDVMGIRQVTDASI